MLESMEKYSIGLWAIEGTADRFVPEGYEEGGGRSTTEALDLLGDVDGINGIEFMSNDFDENEVAEARKGLDENGLEPVGVLVNSWRRDWSLGALTNTDEGTREDVIEYAQKNVDRAKELGCNEVTLWLGSDGFDYPFQVDYKEHWDLLIDGVRQIAEYDDSVEIALEYKLKEPRKHMTIGTALKALRVAEQAGSDNLGVVVDYGHALMGKENVAESVTLLDEEGMLMGVHFNDAYREWDDDMVSGSVNLWDSLEFLYYLDRVNYDGWLTFDIFPFRMPAKEAAKINVRNSDIMIELLEEMDLDRIKKAQKSMDISEVQKALFDVLKK